MSVPVNFWSRIKTKKIFSANVQYVVDSLQCEMQIFHKKHNVLFLCAMLSICAFYCYAVSNLLNTNTSIREFEQSAELELGSNTSDTNAVFLVPLSISQRVPSRIIERIRISTVRSDCQFSAMDSKRHETSKHWPAPRYAVYECSGVCAGPVKQFVLRLSEFFYGKLHTEGTAMFGCSGFCGGLGDRIKGIFSVFLHAMAIGYEFRIDWTFQFPLSPELLAPSQWLDWTEGKSKWSNTVTSHRLNFINTDAKPLGLCDWISHTLVRVKTNAGSIPQRLEGCDFVSPSVHEILNNQLPTALCLQAASNKVPSGTLCMGCIWWYLFQIGKTLETKIVEELDKLLLWKKHMGLEEAFSIALHIRTGDSNMNAGRGREANTANLVETMESCTLSFVKRMGLTKFHAIVVSDSEQAKQLVKRWTWLSVYVVHTRAFHIDINVHESMEATRDSIVSVFVDLFILALQDSLLLSGSSGYGRLAHSIGMYATNNVIECIDEK